MKRTALLLAAALLLAGMAWVMFACASLAQQGSPEPAALLSTDTATVTGVAAAMIAGTAAARWRQGKKAP